MLHCQMQIMRGGAENFYLTKEFPKINFDVLSDFGKWTGPTIFQYPNSYLNKDFFITDINFQTDRISLMNFFFWDLQDSILKSECKWYPEILKEINVVISKLILIFPYIFIERTKRKTNFIYHHQCGTLSK